MQTPLKSIFLLFFLALCTGSFAQVNWEEAVDIADKSFGNKRPRIVLNANNEPLVIWSTSNELMYTKYGEGEFTTPIILHPDTMTSAGAFWMGPDIASQGDTVYVVYKQSPEVEANKFVWIQRSFDGGVTFSPPIKVEDIGENSSRFPTVTVDKNGHPIVGFMKYDASFSEPNWVVTRSNDFGTTFQSDVLSGIHSSEVAEACDCCPGQLVAQDDYVAMLYRDNDEDIRDIYVGLSTDNGETFPKGMNVDKQDWMIMSCPSSGPDGFILEDTLYSVFMNGGSGESRVYYSKSSLTNGDGGSGIDFTPNTQVITQQNYPRMANSGKQAAMVFRQTERGKPQLQFAYTSDIQKQPFQSLELLENINIANADIVMSESEVFIVWQHTSGVVKFKRGTIAANYISSTIQPLEVTVFPNPIGEQFQIHLNQIGSGKVTFFDLTGKTISTTTFTQKQTVDLELNQPTGQYLMEVTLQNGVSFTETVIKN